MAAPLVHIVAEGLSDVHLIRRLLHRELSGDMKFYASQGKMAASTVARNILVHEGGAVLVVVDADTLSAEKQREFEATTAASVQGLLYSGGLTSLLARFKVFTFRPESEVVFFEAPKALEQLIGLPVDLGIVSEGLALPKQTLKRLWQTRLPVSQDSLFQKVDEEIADLLREGEQARRLKDMVLSLIRSSVDTTPLNNKEHEPAPLSAAP